MQAAWETESTYIPYEGRPNFGLTARERQVIALVGAGFSNRDLALELGISENTAKHYLTSVFEKLGVANRIELLLFAVDQGLGLEE